MASPQPGDMAPDFTLPDSDGNSVSLKDFRGKRVVVYFYPKDDTPGCTAQACGFRDQYADVSAADAVILGVSPQGPKSHIAFRDKYGLPFPLLSDEDHAVADAYGVWGPREFAGNKYTGIIRSHFVIGPDGRIEDAQVDVNAAQSVERALAALV